MWMMTRVRAAAAAVVLAAPPTCRPLLATRLLPEDREGQLPPLLLPLLLHMQPRHHQGALLHPERHPGISPLLLLLLPRRAVRPQGRAGCLLPPPPRHPPLARQRSWPVSNSLGCSSTLPPLALALELPPPQAGLPPSRHKSSLPPLAVVCPGGSLGVGRKGEGGCLPPGFQEARSRRAEATLLEDEEAPAAAAGW